MVYRRPRHASSIFDVFSFGGRSVRTVYSCDTVIRESAIPSRMTERDRKEKEEEEDEGEEEEEEKRKKEGKKRDRGAM